MYLMTEEEEQAALTMCQGYFRLKELGWKDIADFEPAEQGSAFLGIEPGSLRPIECEYDKDKDIFTTLDDDDPVERRPRFADLIMFRPYPSPETQSQTPPKKSKQLKQPEKSKQPKQPTKKSKQPKKKKSKQPKQPKKSKQSKKKG